LSKERERWVTHPLPRTVLTVSKYDVLTLEAQDHRDL